MWARRWGASGNGLGSARGAGSRKITNSDTYKITIGFTIESAPKITIKITGKITRRIAPNAVGEIRSKIPNWGDLRPSGRHSCFK